MSADAATPDEGATSLADCQCNEAYYALWGTDGERDLSCRPCPIGASCAAPGFSLEGMPLLRGYFRTFFCNTNSAIFNFPLI